MLIFFVALALSSAKEGWRGTRVMYTSGDRASKTIVHINPDTGTVHNFAFVTSKIVHRTFRGGRFSSHTNIIADTHRGFMLDATHTSSANGKEPQAIVFVYQGSRSQKNSRECKADNKEGCAEVYIAESHDDGLTWTKQFPVLRSDMNDTINRMAPSVAYDPLQSIVYVSYTYKNPITDETELAMVTRKLGTAGYTKEERTIVPGKRKRTLHSRISVTNPGHTVLHMIFIGENSSTDGALYYTRSSDGGKTWESPLDMTPLDHKSGHHSSIDARGNEVYVTYSGNSELDVMFTYSQDNGNTWSPHRKINVQPRMVMHMRACGKTKPLGVLISMLAEMHSLIYEMVYFNATDRTYKQIARPFKDQRDLVNLPLADCEGTKESDVRFVVLGANRQSVVFDDYNYDYLGRSSEME